MGKWTREKVNSENLNGGNQYEAKDRLSREQLNAMVNSGLYAQDFAEHLADTPDTSEANNVGVPTVELVDNGKYKKFKFKNLKGEKGDKGDKGDVGLSGKDGAGCYVNGVATNVNFIRDPQTQIDELQDSLLNVSEIVAENHNFIANKKYLDEAYPIGSIYLSIQDTSPASLFGGSWELLPENSALWTAREDDIFAGVTIEAGLPNITGDVDNIWACKTFDTSPIASGALSLGSQITNGSAGGNGWQMYLHELYFNASKSNSIYGNSTTVQPPAYTVFAWKRVA